MIIPSGADVSPPRQMGGLLAPTPVACSKACASWRTLKSARERPTICRPTGKPSGVNPAGTETAGQNVTVIQYADFIQSPKDYVVSQALTWLFRKDKEFAIWLEARPAAAAASGPLEASPTTAPSAHVGTRARTGREG
jgi:hypothetical protein